MIDEDVIVKMSCCQKCNGIIRIAIKHQMNTKSKNEFMREVMKYNLAVKEISLSEYRQGKQKWCTC